jgi:Ca2+-binding EF-hand superfamily protein
MARKIVAGGDDVTEEVLDRFFEEFDADKNGVIDGREFDAYLKTIS